jgi:predicted RNA-binding protein with RPS1 domain
LITNNSSHSFKLNSSLTGSLLNKTDLSIRNELNSPLDLTPKRIKLTTNEPTYHNVTKNDSLLNRKLNLSSNLTSSSLLNNDRLLSPAQVSKEPKIQPENDGYSKKNDHLFNENGIMEIDFEYHNQLKEILEKTLPPIIYNSSADPTSRLQFMADTAIIKKQLDPIQIQKNEFINLVSSALLRQPNFKNINDPTRQQILSFIVDLSKIDPEFILKLALYTRRELNIRTVANFLLSASSYQKDCRPYLIKYYNASVVLPSDWIEIAEQYQMFQDNDINFGSLPSSLRKCMVDKFAAFDQYQLGKYNKEKSRLAKNNKLKDFRHMKAKIDGPDDKRVAEDKYITNLKTPLKIKDRVMFKVVSTNEKLDKIKFDLYIKDKAAEQEQNSKKNGKKTAKVVEPVNEIVVIRVTLDYHHKSMTFKSFSNNTWTPNPKIINAPNGIDFSKSNYHSVCIYIQLTEESFVISTLGNDSKEAQLVGSYRHDAKSSKTFKNDQFLNINSIRVSGIQIKLKEFQIESLNPTINNGKNEENIEDEENEEEIEKRSYTIKQLIRQLHISSPVENVMALIGKKYPNSIEEFIQTKLPGIFDSERAGKRMKLPTPETWETQVSLRGNIAQVWEQLIDNKKLPYMAMLRNLRNMIKCGISEKHHQLIIKKLQDEGAVVNSKQFPFRFFTAYEVLEELEDDFDKAESLKPAEISNTEVINTKTKSKDKNKTNKPINYSKELLKRYKKALDNALKVATTFNVSPIKGSTAIFLNLNYNMKSKQSKQKSLGKRVQSIGDIAALLALMFKYSCEHSKLILFGNGQLFEDLKLDEGTILENMENIIKTSGSGSKFGQQNFDNLLEKSFLVNFLNLTFKRSASFLVGLLLK